MDNYEEIVKHYEDCFIRHGDNSKGMDWPNELDNLKRFQIMLELIKEKESKVSLLDFGCGTSHLFEFMERIQKYNINYFGCDVSKIFIDKSKEKFPKNQYFNLDILKEPELLPSFDYIVCNGVFTEKRSLSHDRMWEYFKAMVKILFEKSSIGLGFNVMSKEVDWERDDLFHLSTDKLIHFVVTNLSRNFIIRNDYGLYEYSIYIYK